MYDPITECHAQRAQRKKMLTIEYLSNKVMYDKVGSSLLITHLKETLVSNKVYVDCNLKCGVVLLIEKIFNPEQVIRKIRKNAL